MTATALDVLPPSRTTALEIADVAHVQLPRDRTHDRPRTFAYAAGCELPEHTLERADCARMIAGVFALLGRYAQQRVLAVDVALHGASSRAGRVEIALDDAASLGQLSDQLADVLAVMPMLRDVDRRSNVAITLLGQHAQLSLADLPNAHDVHFIFHEQPSGLALTVAYDYGAFRARTIERLIESFALLMVGDDACALRELSMLSYQEARAVEEYGQGPYAAEADEPVAQRFRRVAREHAQANALSFRGRGMSYRELDERSEQLARYLVECGARTAVVCLAPSFDVLVAMLACLKAGVLYVPLDPGYPPALVEALVLDVEPQLALTHEGLGALPETLPRLLLDRDFEACVRAADRPLAMPAVELEQGAYVLYTSGTTGRPKGVLASQRNLAHYLKVARERFGFAASDVFCSLARYTFSISFFELLSPLMVGGELLLLDRDDVLDPQRLLASLERVTVLHAGPSLLSSLFRHLHNVRAPHDFPSLRHASSGGDLVGPDLLAEMRRVFRAAELYVLYGCTEIACMGTAYAVRGKTRGHMVGSPFADTSVRVLDANGRTLPFGVVGEIYFAGKGVARRYLNQPTLSTQRFVCVGGQRLYRTGDLGRMHDDGNLEILGRSDFQVQVRGMRVELAGIESTIRARGLARQCAVIASARADHDVRLVAFVVEPATQDLRRALAEQLPDYMVPQGVVELEALPLTANGKLDRKRLAELALAAPRSSGTQAESRLEVAVAEAYARVLGLPRVGVEDDFFALGGHSLTAVLLVEALQERLGLRVSPGTLFEHTTVRSLAAALESEPYSDAARPVLLNQSPEAPALFLLLGVHLYREVARELEGQFAVYGVYADSELAMIAEPSRAPSVAEFARDYLDAIRTQQPHGPYRIGGMSFGGIVAYEVAQQLRAAGEEVELLAMFDAVLPMTRWQKLLRLAGMPRRQRARALFRRLASRQQPAEFLKYQDDAQLGSIEQRRQLAYARSARRYLREIRPYEGAVTLVVAGARVQRDPLADARCGFASLVPSLRVHTLRREHLALLESGGVGELLLADLGMASGRRCLPPPFKLELVRTGA
jgi:amino acid adenylation domain-containing protein